MLRPPPTTPLFPYTTLFRSNHPVSGNGGASSVPRPITVKVMRLPSGEGLPLPARMTAQAAGFDLPAAVAGPVVLRPDRKSTRLNSSHLVISYAVFCLKKKKK